MTQLASSAIETIGVAELLEFFQQSYGPAFVGRDQFLDFYINRADTAVYTGEVPDLSAFDYK